MGTLRRYLVVTIPTFVPALKAVFGELENAETQFTTTLDEFKKITAQKEFDILITFSTGVIIPAKNIGSFLAAYNFHAASPEFPGRDPHHFAVYRKANSYGATAHYLTAKVDDGPIIGIENFAVDKHVSPKQLLAKANEVNLDLLKRLLPEIQKLGKLPALNINWGKTKTTRRDFENMCLISPDISAEELELRIRSFSSEGYQNIVLDLHGRRFILADKA